YRDGDNTPMFNTRDMRMIWWCRSTPPDHPHIARIEKVIATTRRGQYPNVQYARYADDLVVLIDSHPRHEWIVKAVEKRLREELAKLRVEINEEKSRMVDLSKGEGFSFLGFEYRRVHSRTGKWRPHYVPKLKKIGRASCRESV